MNKSEKIYAAILLGVVLIEMIALIACPIVMIITAGDWSSCIMWALVPWLAAEIYTFCFIMRHWEDIK